MVRAPDEPSALKRLLNVVEKYHIDISSPQYFNRIKIVLGDISKPFFGIGEKQFSCLNKKIDIIYHLASHNNFIMPYSVLYPTNVFGCKEILRFATTEKIIPIHYVSTLAIFSCIHFFKDIEKIDEFSNSSDSVHYLKYDIGYVQTKWVSDQLMQNASKNNIPITISRPGFVLCHSKTKAIADNQFWHNFINECVKLGSYPRLVGQKEELVSVEQIILSNGKVDIEKKSDMKRRGVASPNMADALALTFAGGGAIQIGSYSGSGWGKINTLKYRAPGII